MLMAFVAVSLLGVSCKEDEPFQLLQKMIILRYWILYFLIG